MESMELIESINYHPLLNHIILSRVFNYLSIDELRRARFVCNDWKTNIGNDYQIHSWYQTYQEIKQLSKKTKVIDDKRVRYFCYIKGCWIQHYFDSKKVFIRICDVSKKYNILHSFEFNFKVTDKYAECRTNFTNIPKIFCKDNKNHLLYIVILINNDYFDFLTFDYTDLGDIKLYRSQKSDQYDNSMLMSHFFQADGLIEDPNWEDFDFLISNVKKISAPQQLMDARFYGYEKFKNGDLCSHLGFDTREKIAKVCLIHLPDNDKPLDSLDSLDSFEQLFPFASYHEVSICVPKNSERGEFRYRKSFFVCSNYLLSIFNLAIFVNHLYNKNDKFFFKIHSSIEIFEPVILNDQFCFICYVWPKYYKVDEKNVNRYGAYLINVKNRTHHEFGSLKHSEILKEFPTAINSRQLNLNEFLVMGYSVQFIINVKTKVIHVFDKSIKHLPKIIETFSTKATKATI